MQQPILTTPRLTLRPASLDDAEAIEHLASEREIARMTLTIPHPYPAGEAKRWIAEHSGKWERSEEAVFALVRTSDLVLVGVIGLNLTLVHRRAELGYWVGKEFQGVGYATEAARAMLKLGFETLGLDRIHAAHFSDNPASGKVLRRVGMKHEGRLRRHIWKWGEPRDLEEYGILREDYRGITVERPAAD